MNLDKSEDDSDHDSTGRDSPPGDAGGENCQVFCIYTKSLNSVCLMQATSCFSIIQCCTKFFVDLRVLNLHVVTISNFQERTVSWLKIYIKHLELSLVKTRNNSQHSLYVPLVIDFYCLCVLFQESGQNKEKRPAKTRKTPGRKTPSSGKARTKPKSKKKRKKISFD